MRRLATISAMLLLMGLALAALGILPPPSDDHNVYHLGGSDDWSLEDHYYEPPTDPATAGNWGNRTPVKYVAASDSSAEDNEFVANQGENGYQCDGVDDHVEINAALASITGGGKVFLFEGHYNIGSRITLYTTSNVSLVGANRENTIISTASGLFSLCSIYSNKLVENLTFIGAGRSIEGECNGIMLVESVVIRNCLVENVSAIGIYAEMGIRDLWIIDCEVRNTGNQGIVFDGINRQVKNVYAINNTVVDCGIGSPDYLGGGNGIAFWWVKHGLVVNNTIRNSGQRGISLTRAENILIQGNLVVDSGSLSEGMIAGINLHGVSALATENITIRGNEILDNQVDNQDYGIEFYNEYVQNCVVDKNHISNHEYGIYICSSSNNRIYHNNLINNTTQAYDNGSNQWDDGYPSGGNYWSDYTGEDNYRGEDQNLSGSDRIGDTPYYIPGDNNLDRYPLMNPWPTRGVEVSISPDYQSGVPCTTLDYTVTVKNTGNVQENYTLTKSDNAGWEDDVTLEDDWLVVQPGENQTTTLHVHIPDDAIACTEDNVIITAASQKNAEIENNASCIVHATTVQILRVDVSISPGENWAENGETLTFTVTVTNRGTVSDDYDLDVNDNVGWSPAILPESLSLGVGASGTATLSITIPGDAENCTRDNITVTATSQTDNMTENSASSIAHCLVPPPMRGVEISISPTENEGSPGETIILTVTVTNLGAAQDSFDLTMGESLNWGPTLDESLLGDLAPNESREITLRVTIPEDATAYTRDNIRVRATSQGDPTVYAEDLCTAHAVAKGVSRWPSILAILAAILAATIASALVARHLKKRRRKKRRRAEARRLRRLKGIIEGEE